MASRAARQLGSLAFSEVNILPFCTIGSSDFGLSFRLTENFIADGSYYTISNIVAPISSMTPTGAGTAPSATHGLLTMPPGGRRKTLGASALKRRDVLKAVFRCFDLADEGWIERERCCLSPHTLFLWFPFLICPPCHS